MEMPVKGFRGQPVEGSCDAIATALPSDNIRMITLKINSSQTVLDDCVATPWVESTPANVADFSATAYFFASYLRKVFNVPVGVICSRWGGSKIESWINKEVYTEIFPEISLYYFYFFIRMVGAKMGEFTHFILVGSYLRSIPPLRSSQSVTFSSSTMP